MQQIEQLKPRLHKEDDLWVCQDANGNDGCGYDPIEAYEDYSDLKAMKDAYRSAFAGMYVRKPTLIDRLAKWVRG